jgi:4-hydroxy-tetrahydrodipicolinate reductase
MVDIIMHGCNGRMGQMITGLVTEDPDVRIVAGIDVAGGQKNDYPVFTSVNDCNVKADVVIDFGAASAVDGLLDWCISNQIPCVECTTGLTDEQIQHLEDCAGKVAILKSANMSLGINVLMKLLAEATKVFADAGFDIEIVKILNRHPDRDRGIDIPKEKYTADVNDILNDPEIDIVVELMGGIEPAAEYMARALMNYLILKKQY